VPEATDAAGLRAADIPVLEARGVRVTSIKASVSPRGSDPLLGLSFLHRFDSYTIDRTANELLLK
jgi:predicted aspartyl protease